MSEVIKNILLIEDDSTMALASRIKLERAGFRVNWCMSAEIAMRSIETGRPDFVWLDFLLPGMSGVEFLQWMRDHEQYHDIPVMLVTVSMSAERAKKAFELNVVDVVVKSEHELGDIVGQVTSYFESCSGEC